MAILSKYFLTKEACLRQNERGVLRLKTEYLLQRTELSKKNANILSILLQLPNTGYASSSVL